MNYYHHQGRLILYPVGYVKGHRVNGLKLDWQHSACRERCAIKKCTYGRMAVSDGKICPVTSIPQILCARGLSHNLHFMSHTKYVLVLQNPMKNEPFIRQTVW